MSIYILDSGLGSELTNRGFHLPGWKDSIWSAKALAENPQLIKEIHIDNIQAGCNVITTSNYYATPVILKNSPYNFLELSKVALAIAEEAIRETNSTNKVMIAGSFPPINVTFRPDLENSEEELEDFYSSLALLYKERVDLILCESMASIFTGTTAARVARHTFNKVWLSWTARGLNPDMLPSGESLDDAVLQAKDYDLDCQLINCGHADQATKSLEVLKKHIENYGVFANSSIFKENDVLEKFESVDDIHHHHSAAISASEYAAFAKIWIEMGSKVIGGCCRTTPEHIKMILKDL
tara:strand:- start:349 stop:1236 length:888 start_codon:yes stop_codon:yes gene_type:complete